MQKNEQAPNFVEQPLMSTGTSEAGFDNDTMKSKPGSKPRIGKAILGDDGITGRIK
jgi:hypothetical protein